MRHIRFSLALLTAAVVIAVVGNAGEAAPAATFTPTSSVWTDDTLTPENPWVPSTLVGVADDDCVITRGCEMELAFSLPARDAFAFPAVQFVPQSGVGGWGPAMGYTITPGIPVLNGTAVGAFSATLGVVAGPCPGVVLALSGTLLDSALPEALEGLADDQLDPISALSNVDSWSRTLEADPQFQFFNPGFPNYGAGPDGIWSTIDDDGVPLHATYTISPPPLGLPVNIVVFDLGPGPAVGAAASLGASGYAHVLIVGNPLAPWSGITMCTPLTLITTYTGETAAGAADLRVCQDVNQDLMPIPTGTGITHVITSTDPGTSQQIMQVDTSTCSGPPTPPPCPPQVTDADLDGIEDGIDRSILGAGTDQSGNPSNNTFNDGTTFGVIEDTGGWMVCVTDLPSDGVQVSISGSGTLPGAQIDTCGPDPRDHSSPFTSWERTILDVVGESADITCVDSTDPDCSTPKEPCTTVHAVQANGDSACTTPPPPAPPATIELRKPPHIPGGGGGVRVCLNTSQTATEGSTITADPNNIGSVLVQIVDQNDNPFGSFQLAPGQAADVDFPTDTSVTVTNLGPGPLTITVSGVTATLSPGESQTFDFPPVGGTVEFRANADALAEESGSSSARDYATPAAAVAAGAIAIAASGWYAGRRFLR